MLSYQLLYLRGGIKLDLLRNTRCLGQPRGGIIDGEAGGLSRRGGASIERVDVA